MRGMILAADHGAGRSPCRAWSGGPPRMACRATCRPRIALSPSSAIWMRAAVMDREIDPVGSVVGRYPAADSRGARTLIVGSHYDTVRDAGKYGGRLGILATLVVVERLAFHWRGCLSTSTWSRSRRKRGCGSRRRSSAAARSPDGLTSGCWSDATLRYKLGGMMCESGLEPEAIRRRGARQDLVGYLEVHIEQGPVIST